jgi:deferrochelatase/peroxidase EfeB
VVEVCRQLREVGGLEPVAFFPGYRRADRRSWLGFHDGVANPDIDDRPAVLRIPDAAAPAWLAGGTYLAFLRIRVRLDCWDSLDPVKQELAVGRHRATGAPLEVNPDQPGDYRPMTLPAPGDVFARGNERAREAMPCPADHPSGIGASHIQRSRRHVTGRILRQGYEYLEPVAGPDVFHTGLNFVSFQSSPALLTRILTNPNWLGCSAFGGPDGDLADLLEVYAAGVFAVPPPAATGCPGIDAVQPPEDESDTPRT